MKQIAITIGDRIYQTVNTPEMVGTKDETGYVVMFFNARNHNGKSPLVASDMDRASLKKLLEYALRHVDDASVIDPGRRQ